VKTSHLETPSTRQKLVDAAPAETTASGWKSLYMAGGSAALIMAVFIPIQIVVFFAYPPPDTVIGWFTLFQHNRLLGLLDMDLLLIVDQILMSVILLALYVVLRRISQSFMAIALTSGLLGIAAYFASSTAFNMLSLSDQYAAATTNAQKALLLSAGQVTLTAYQGTAFDVGYVLEGVAILIVAVVMLRSPGFSKVTAVVGMVLGAMSLVPPTVGAIGLFVSLSSLLPLEIWLILVALRLFQLRQTIGKHAKRFDVASA
jgi:hypothetical protein